MTARRLPLNVYRTPNGSLRAVAKVGVHRRDEVFPANTSNRDLNTWLETERKKLRALHRARKRSKGTLRVDVETHLALLPRGRTKSDIASNLAAWVLALGERRRALLTVFDLRRVVKDWLEAGVAANTINHRRRALVQLYDNLDGDELPNVARQLRRQPEPDLEPRAVSMTLLDAIIETMDEQRTVRHPGRGGRGFRNKTRARLLMLLWVGLSPESLRRLRPEHVNLAAEEITLPSRSKGRGAPPVTLPLWPRGVDACRAWLRAFAWGRFDERALSRCFHSAVKRYKVAEASAGRPVTLPADLQVKDLRHSFLTWVWEQSGDSLLVQHFGQHRDLKTTRRYTGGAVGKLARASVQQLRERLVLSVATDPQKPQLTHMR